MADYLPNVNGTATLPQHNTPLELKCYTDSVWAGDKTTHRSTIGYLCSLFNSPYSYASRSQAVVFVDCQSQTHGTIFRDGRGITPTTTDTKKLKWFGADYFQLRPQKDHHTTDSTSATSLASRQEQCNYSPVDKAEATTACGVETTSLQARYHNVAW